MINLRQKIDAAKEVAKKNLKTILIDVGVAGVSIAFVLYQELVLTPTDLNPLLLIARALLGIIVGILIKQALGENGFTRGYRSELWLSRKERYNLKCDVALPYVDKVDEFYEAERKRKLMDNRKTRLAGCRMKYSTFFDENGDYIEHEIIKKEEYLLNKKYGRVTAHSDDYVILDRKQRKCLEKCVKLKIFIRNLFTEYETDISAYEHKERNDKDQRKYNLRKNTIGAIIIATLGVYFIPEFSWNWGRFIWSLLQVAVWITFGIVQLYDNYYFVTVEKTEILKTKETDITRFLISQVGTAEAKKMLELKEEEKALIDKGGSKDKVIEIEMTEEELKGYQNK